ncbi:EamA-like transporter family protein [Maioricimonas rarisocia]|uniref:EamA-like transporter family protein n=1 Tax=Maioricimonas rarisocia TaxID=2528026 RepID=A0A517Z929_9PLAN|nr:EamA family transporter [Maioricimonas rarisocia]QDU38966.1 EamA-like transporter family protein [Maioricimonas rarisocia]
MMESERSVDERPWGLTPATWGILLGVLAAVGYTLTNMALRRVAYRDDLGWALWVSCHKGIPSTIAALVLVGVEWARGHDAALPRGRQLVMLIGTALIMQFGGNVLFQIALSYGGLALTVPLVFATIIVGGAVLGRVMLGEPVGTRMLLAMSVTIVAIFVLSQGAGAASLAMGQRPTGWSTLWAILAACLSGLSYGLCGVVIRRCVTNRMSIAATLLPLSVTGVIGLGATSVALLGPRGVLTTAPEDLLAMVLAGVFNAVAFFAISAAYKRLSVVNVNLINASQCAMAAAAGVLLFAEPLTISLGAGTLLTLLGLFIMASRRPAPPPAETTPRPEEPATQTEDATVTAPQPTVTSQTR